MIPLVGCLSPLAQEVLLYKNIYLYILFFFPVFLERSVPICINIFYLFIHIYIYICKYITKYKDLEIKYIYPQKCRQITYQTFFNKS